MNELVLSQNKVFSFENVDFNPQNPLARFEFTCITQLFEAAGLTLVSLKNGSYTSKEHDSLIIHGENSPKYPNTFYWNSISKGGGFGKAKKALLEQGYSFSDTFIPKERIEFALQKKIIRDVNEKIAYIFSKSGGLDSNFHVFCRKYLKISDSEFRKYGIGTYSNIHGKKTVFSIKTLENELIGLQNIDYLQNGKRNKENPFSIQTIQKIENEKPKYGCFGEANLVAGKEMIIVEAPKTAFLGDTSYGKDYQFIALQGKNGLHNLEATLSRYTKKYGHLPKISAFLDNDKAGKNLDLESIEKAFSLKIEKYFFEGCKGFDFADYIIKNIHSLPENPFQDAKKVESENRATQNKLAKQATKQNTVFACGKNAFKFKLQTSYLGTDIAFANEYDKFQENYRQFILQALTGLGKTDFIVNRLKQGYGRQAIFFAPNLTNLLDVKQRAIKVGLKESDILVNANQNFVNGITEECLSNNFTESKLVLSTFQSSSKLLKYLKDLAENTKSEAKKILENYENYLSLYKKDLFPIDSNKELFELIKSYRLVYKDKDQVLHKVVDYFLPTLVIDEAHDFSNFSQNFVEFLDKTDLKTVFLSATPQKALTSYFDIPTLQVLPKDAKIKKYSFVSCQNTTLSLYQKTLETLQKNKKHRFFVALQTIEEQKEYVKFLENVLHIDSQKIALINAKVDFSEYVKKGHFEGKQFVIFTAVIKAGLSFFDKFDSVYMVQNAYYKFSFEDFIQVPNRLRGDNLPPVSIFRNDKHTKQAKLVEQINKGKAELLEKQSQLTPEAFNKAWGKWEGKKMNFQNENATIFFEQTKKFAELHCGILNGMASGAIKENEICTVEKIHSFVHKNDYTQSYFVSDIAILQMAIQAEQDNLSNTGAAEFLSAYEENIDFEFESIEENEFDAKVLEFAQLAKTEKQAKRLENLDTQIELLESAKDLEAAKEAFKDIKSELNLLDRVLFLIELGHDFEAAKKLVLDNTDGTKWSTLVFAEKTRYLDKTENPTRKESLNKKVILDFKKYLLDNIGKPIKAFDLNNEFVRITNWVYYKKENHFEVPKFLNTRAGKHTLYALFEQEQGYEIIAKNQKGIGKSYTLVCFDESKKEITRLFSVGNSYTSEQIKEAGLSLKDVKKVYELKRGRNNSYRISDFVTQNTSKRL